MPNEGSTQLEYASFFPRFIAHLWDSIILGIVVIAIYFFSDWVKSPGSPWYVGNLGGLPPIDARGQLLISALSFIAFAIPFVYFVYFEGKDSATPGKKIMRLRIVSTSGLYPIGYAKAVLRLIGRVVSSAILSLGYLWILIDEKKQGWHDKIAGTYVVRS